MRLPEGEIELAVVLFHGEPTGPNLASLCLVDVNRTVHEGRIFLGGRLDKLGDGGRRAVWPHQEAYSIAAPNQRFGLIQGQLAKHRILPLLRGYDGIYRAQPPEHSLVNPCDPIGLMPSTEWHLEAILRE